MEKLILKRIKTLKVFAISSIIVLFSVYLFVYLIQDKLLFPGMRNGMMGSQDLNYDIPQNTKEIFLKSTDGENIQVWQRLLDDSKNALAIILTGNGDNVTGAGKHYQDWFASLNIQSLAFSYRGYGKSSGHPSEEGLRNDIEAVYKYAKKLNAKKIIIFAVSIGTGPGTYIALKEKADVLLLVSPYTSLKDIVRDHTVLKFFTPLLKTNFSNKSEFSKAKEFPCTLLVHGEADTVIPSSQSEELFKLAAENKNVKLELYKKAGHNDIMSYAKNYLEKEIIHCLGNDLD